MASEPQHQSTKILVLGAGELGLPILQSLATHPVTQSSPDVTVTLLLRPSSLASPSPSITSLQSFGVQMIACDIASSSIDEVAQVFKGYDTIVSCLGYASGPGTQLKLVKAVLATASLRRAEDAERKRPKLRYFPWQFGVDYAKIGPGSSQDLFDEQLEVRRILRSHEDDVEWVIVSTGVFMSYLFSEFFGIVELKQGEGGVVRALGSWDNMLTVTTVEDIGKLTAEILFTQHPHIANQIVYVASDTLSYSQVGDVVDFVVQHKRPGGRKVKRELWTVEHLDEELRKDPNDVLKKYRATFARGEGVAWDFGETFNWERGIEVVRAREWAEEHLSV
ncbi:hypothetical protein JAAARDRAFT_175603 [Jaapia argillacea MUCL 33604]|uniref:NmrA-like domain-containing protein n=1 Tax=Jaapia argillacea MUCL 33604 TaxID=933084 RepID=A0A067Q669_9AGAM|nr:hypothetical protein JAAARDRAFT_175603 [Jaapia argillacea MUCL 33604]